MRWKDRLARLLNRPSRVPPSGSAPADESGRAGHSSTGAFQVEYEPPQTSVCGCCGGRTTRLTRFVKRDGDAWAVYLVRYGESRKHPGADAVVSLGTWSVDEVPPDRVAFAMHIGENGDEYQLGLVDAAESPWHDAAVLGRKLSRGEALAHPWLPRVYELFDHFVHHDPPLNAFLDGTSA